MFAVKSKARLWIEIRMARQRLGYDPDETFTITKHYSQSLLRDEAKYLSGRTLTITGLTDKSSTIIRVDPKNYRLACNEDGGKLKPKFGENNRVELYKKFYPLEVSRHILADVLNCLI